MAWSERAEIAVNIVVQKLGDEDYVAEARTGDRRDRFRGTEPEAAFRTACDWAAKYVAKDA